MPADIKIKELNHSLRSINFDAFGGFQGFLDATSNGAGGTASVQQLRRVVPWLAKATDMTANAIASLPFEIVNDKGDVFDSSADWKNKLGGIENPQMLLTKLASSLCLGRAYLIPTYTSRALVSLQYCAPHTVVPQINQQGLQFFDRSTDQGKTDRFYPMDKGDPEMMYFWLPDSDVEIGPALSYPAGAALLSAKLLFSMDGTIQTYSERGFVPATLLTVKGMPGPGEREKAETWWNKFLRGWTSTAAKIMNAEAMDIKQVGAGMEQLKGAYGELTKQAIENVGTAYGIPAALFMSDMAYASEANAMIKVWYQTSAFVKIYKTIENTMTDQLLGMYGMKWLFKPESIDAFQEEESTRASAFKIYVDAGIKKSIAAQMVGLELPTNVEYEDLDDEEPEPVVQVAPVQPEAEEEEPEEIEEKPVEKSLSLTADQIKELNLWRQISERHERKGEARVLDFKCKSLDAVMADDIRTKLKSGCTIAQAFELNGRGPETIGENTIDNEGLKMLAESINKMMEQPEVKAQPLNITMSPINLTAQMPQPDQPSIVINVPEQPAPNVTVTSPDIKVINEVNPTPVTIDNTVNVPEEKSKKLKVIRDNKGVVTGMEEK